MYRNLRIEEHVAQGLLRLLGHAGHSMSEAREPGEAKAPDDASDADTSDRPLEPPRAVVSTKDVVQTKNVVQTKDVAQTKNHQGSNEDAGEPDAELASRRLREFLEHAARSLSPQPPQGAGKGKSKGKSAAGESGTSQDERSSQRRRDARICPSAIVWRRGLVPVSRAETEYQQMIRWIKSQRAK